MHKLIHFINIPSLQSTLRLPPLFMLKMVPSLTESITSIMAIPPCSQPQNGTNLPPTALTTVKAEFGAQPSGQLVAFSIELTS